MEDNSQKMQYHPLYDDSLFAPNDLKYVVLQQPAQEAYSQIVVPIINDKIPLEQIQPRDRGANNERIKKIFGVENSRHPRQEKHEKCTTLSEYKMTTGNKQQSVMGFQYMKQSIVKKSPLVKDINQSKYEICMIMFKNFDPFAISLRWSDTINVEKQLLDKINKLYSSQLTLKDIDINQLSIQISENKSYDSFLFKRMTRLSEDTLKQLVFGQSQPVFIGIDINSSKFKERKPNRMVLYDGQAPPNLKSQIMSNPIKDLAKFQKEDKPRIIDIELSNKKIRINYFQVKYYKIKFFLGLLGQKDYDRKGLTVLDKVYRPDDYIYDMAEIFEVSNDTSFVQIKISSEKELFFKEIQSEVLLNPSQLLQLLAIDKPSKIKNPCLSAYLNQAKFPRDNSKAQNLLTAIIKNVIHNYFLEYHTKETSIWKSFIKIMLKQMEGLETYRGWAYRVVNYEYEKNQLEYINFSNVLVMTKDSLQVDFRLDPSIAEKNTLFRIKSVSGKVASGLSAFGLQQIIYPPYTSFQVVRKSKKMNLTEYELEQVKEKKIENRLNLLVWVDDKPKEAQNLFNYLISKKMEYPIYFFQATSNIEFQNIVTDNKYFFENPNSRKIIVSNMRRSEKGKIIENAGVETHRLSEKMFGRGNVDILYYIGYVEGTRKKLDEGKVDPQSYSITSDGNELVEHLRTLCMWQDYQQQDIGKEYKFGKSNIGGGPLSTFKF